MGSAINLDDIKRFEVTEVYTHPDAKVDVVLVHGLNGDPRLTWTATNGVFWPTQLLPITLKSAQARILVYGYNADVYAFGNNQSPSSDMIHQHAQTLLTNLTLERKSEEVSDHPIIFVAHSLGGILVKKALEMSEQYRGKSADDLRSIFVSTYGLMFLGTPHNGADPAKWGLILQGMVSALVPKKFMDTEAPLVKTLQKNNETLHNINLDFLEIVRRFKVCMVHEAVKTDLHGTRGFIVDKDSAAPLLPDVVYFGIEATHSGMCKFATKNSPGYLAVSTTIKSWVQDCIPVIRARQNFEITTIRLQKDFEAEALRDRYGQQSTAEAPTNTSPDPSSVNNSTITVISTVDISPETTDGPTPRTPYFIKPSGQRPNSLFVGRHTELEDLHKKLFDEKRRKDGTSAVLIQCMPGGGKTHLAREYVYTHRDEFPGGIFWVPAKSQTEFAAGFWDIARKAALKHLPKEDINAAGGDSQQFMKMAKKWLNHRQRWLMVIDGIHFDSMGEVQKYIPDSKDTCLIYTSTEKAVSGDYHWMNPQIIKLPLLSAREAQELLLLELGKSAPFSTDDLKHSMELVQSMGLLPVVIHAVAQRLKNTDEPLAKFARSFASEPQLRGLDTYVAVVNQLKVLGAYEALNLMYILSFFSRHVPVEMISLGLKALDELNIRVKSCDRFSGRTLNNTFKILNLFALIERNEQDVSVQSSQSSQRSREMLADNIDVINLHSVVQGFFADTLHADQNPRAYFIWLDRAVRLFCCSSDMAGARIARKTNTGLVEDYRLYEIHGIKLREHCTRHEKKAPMPETLAMLDVRLAAIKYEIERRTPESSSYIARGGVNASQTSIFDRTSSSSDTNPETPGGSDKGGISTSPTWVVVPEQEQHASPIDVLHHKLGPGDIFKGPFPIHIPDDPGYDSDLEETVQPSPQTVRPPGSPGSPGGIWEKVLPRRRPRPARFEMGDHRTTRTLERNKYSDRAGSFRSLEAVDPRAVRAQLTRETAHGFVQNAPSRASSRGRMSGQSTAEVALAHISANSPPPARGRGVIHDRRSISQRSTERGRFLAGAASYAAVVSGFARDAVFGEADQPVFEPQASSRQHENPSTEDRRQSTAVQSLQQFSVSTVDQPASPRAQFTPMPPYPSTPGLEYEVRYPGSSTSLYQPSGRYNQENLPFMTDQSSSNLYPRLTGPVPCETIDPSVSVKRNSGHGFSGYDSQNDPESLESSIHTAQNPPFLSLSSPNISLGGDTYYPGHLEFSSEAHEGGYTSQPMSRDPSGQSTHSDHSHHSTTQTLYAAEWNRRRPSLAETEPAPQLPDFSPRIPPTSYELYRDREETVGTRRGSRLEVSKLAQRLENWTVDTDPTERNPVPKTASKSRFNPAAPAFTPSSSSFTYSPTLPKAPQNSMLSNPSNDPSPLVAQVRNSSPLSFQSAPAVQYPPVPRITPPPFVSHSSAPYPQPPHTTPASFAPGRGRGGDEMTRSGSGGVRVGRQVIGFGDFPDTVEVSEARERADRVREALGITSREVGLGISDVRR